MADKTTPNAANLVSLGAERLAELLAEFADDDAQARRRLRVELAARAAPDRVAAEVRRRLGALARARTRVERRHARRLAADVDAQRRAIVDRVAEIDAGEAHELMWRLLALARPLSARTEDHDDALAKVFAVACRDVGSLAARANAPPLALADRALAALRADDELLYHGLIAALAPVLGRPGLEHLRRCAQALAAKAATFELASFVRSTVQAAADAQGDPDGFAAAYSDRERQVPRAAAAIAHRFMAAGRAADALQAVDAATARDPRWPEIEWVDARIAALEALGRAAEAQAMRLDCHMQRLSAPHLREYLKRLPGAEDVEAERRALDRAESWHFAVRGLDFLVAWRALDRAARMLLARAAEMEGRRSDILVPAAAALAARYPLAATLALRQVIGDALRRGRPKLWPAAADHLAECARLAGAVRDWGDVVPHAAYAAGLRRLWGHHRGFWALAHASLGG